MPKVNCPLWRKRYDCEECAFFETEHVSPPTCRFEAVMVHLNELTQNVRLVQETGEQHRETYVQQLRSMLRNEPTGALLRLVGVKDASH